MLQRNLRSLHFGRVRRLSDAPEQSGQDPAWAAPDPYRPSGSTYITKNLVAAGFDAS
jgi:hypothetical protein